MNGVITSLGLMIWVYISMRALYQAEESRTWYGFFEAIIGVSFINYFCYELILNSASLNEFKDMSRSDTDNVGFALLAGTVVAVTIAAVRAFRRLERPSAFAGPIMATEGLTREEIQKRIDDHKRSLGITVP